MRHLSAIILLALSARAAEPLVLGEAEPMVMSVAPHLEVLIDPDGRLSAEEAMRGDWKPESRPLPSFGYTRDTVWLRFKVRSEAKATRTLHVDLATARLSHLRWHVVGDGKVLASIDGGSADKPTVRGKAGRLPLLRLELPAGSERTVLVRAASDTSIWLPLSVAGPEAHARMEDGRALSILLQVGFYLALMFLALLMGLAQRQAAYLHLVLVAVGYAIYIGGFNGFLGRAFPSLPTWAEREGILLPAVLSVYCFTRLCGNLLGRSTLRRHETLLQRVAEGSILVAAALFLLADFRTAARGLIPLLLLCILTSLAVAASRLRRRGGEVEAAFVVAWTIYALCIAWLALSFMGAIPMTASVATVQSLLLPTVLSAFFVAVIARQRSLQQAEVQLERSRTAESEARLEALRYQINPHFLFNTLTSIDGLARSEPARIPGLVSRLATFLRLRLVTGRQPTLREELESAVAYLEIEQVRFGEDLAVSSEADKDTLDLRVPELILQPLVENAVKHGVRAGARTNVTIRARREGDRLVVSVGNEGTLARNRKPRESLGIGLENVRSRLALLHGTRATLDLAESEGKVTATLTLPANR